jgi:serine/threonine protein phosphatase PrpC
MKIKYDYNDFDWNQDITRDNIDLTIYHNKFKFVDKVKGMTKPHPRYWKMINDDKTMFSYAFLRLDGEPIELYPYQDLILNDTHTRKYFKASNQIGKVLDNDTDILTYNRGWIKNGDIKAGDTVFGSDGKPTRVTHVYPHNDWQFYKITFTDGSYIFAGAEHLWKCKTERERFVKYYYKGLKRWKNETYGKWVVRRTDEIIESGSYSPYTRRRGKNVSIPITKPVDIDLMRVLPLRPYMVGLLIGDGGYANNSCIFTTDDEELVDEFKKDFEVVNFKKQHYRINGITKFLRELGIQGSKSWNKNVPEKYLFSSIENRKQLLRGLMDTDGTVYGEHSTLEFCTTSENLKEDFVFLVNSLGGKINKITKRKPFFKKDGKRVYGKDAYYVRFSVPFNPFNLRRKATLFKPMTVHKYERIIDKIEVAHVGDGKCITVDNEDHTYLAGKELIVTHNSISLDVDAVYDFVQDHGRSNNAAIVSKSLPQSMHQMRRIKQLLNSMQLIDWREDKGSTDNTSIITLDVKEEIKDKDGQVIDTKIKYTNMIICAPCTEGLLGYDLHKLYLDEFEFWDIDTEYFYKQIAQPRTYRTNGTIMITTNPNGSDNYGAKLENQLMVDGKTKKWHVYTFNYLDCPGNTKEEYDQLKYELSRREFESTVAAIRTASEHNFFTPDEIHSSEDSKLRELDMVGKQPFFFLDVGATHDRSVLVAGYIEPDEHNDKFTHLYIPIIHVYPQGYPINRVVGSKVEDSDGWHSEKSVKDYLDEWSQDGTQPVFGCDVTGNSGIIPLFNAIDIYPIDIVFSGPSKSGMYQRFKYYMEKGLLHRIPHDKWESEANQLVMTKGRRGYLYNSASHAESGGKKLDRQLKALSDDCLDATAGLLYLADNPDIAEPSLVVI